MHLKGISPLLTPDVLAGLAHLQVGQLVALVGEGFPRVPRRLWGQSPWPMSGPREVVADDCGTRAILEGLLQHVPVDGFYYSTDHDREMPGYLSQVLWQLRSSSEDVLKGSGIPSDQLFEMARTAELLVRTSETRCNSPIILRMGSLDKLKQGKDKMQDVQAAVHKQSHQDAAVQTSPRMGRANTGTRSTAPSSPPFSWPSTHSYKTPPTTPSAIQSTTPTTPPFTTPPTTPSAIQSTTPTTPPFTTPPTTPSAIQSTPPFTAPATATFDKKSTTPSSRQRPTPSPRKRDVTTSTSSTSTASAEPSNPTSSTSPTTSEANLTSSTSPNGTAAIVDSGPAPHTAYPLMIPASEETCKIVMGAESPTTETSQRPGSMVVFKRRSLTHRPSFPPPPPPCTPNSEELQQQEFVESVAAAVRILEAGVDSPPTTSPHPHPPLGIPQAQIRPRRLIPVLKGPGSVAVRKSVSFDVNLVREIGQSDDTTEILKSSTSEKGTEVNRDDPLPPVPITPPYHIPATPPPNRTKFGSLPEPKTPKKNNAKPRFKIQSWNDVPGRKPYVIDSGNESNGDARSSTSGHGECVAPSLSAGLAETTPGTDGQPAGERTQPGESEKRLDGAGLRVDKPPVESPVKSKSLSIKMRVLPDILPVNTMTLPTPRLARTRRLPSTLKTPFRSVPLCLPSPATDI